MQLMPKAKLVRFAAKRRCVLSEFKGTVWRIDVGMSSRIQRAPPEVLEIVEDKFSCRAPYTHTHVTRRN
ncbi:hypothetical protein R1flu_022922 [Riccia fluitans]|uniref:Uncharacterized protein n=1 Tax=Riccia fluitans TaxID=41844 RepID=A0ABD1XR33_9MARC